MSALTQRRWVGDAAPEAAVADLARALDLIAADPAASALLSGARETVEMDTPLATWLYQHWWMGVTTVSGSTPDRGLLAALEAGRRAAAPVTDGLLVLATDGVQLVAGRRGSRTVHSLEADAVVDSSRPGCAPRPGDLVSAFAGSGRRDPAGGWWWARTNAAADDDLPMDRWYLAVDAADAPVVVEAAVALATELGVALSLKCPTRPDDFARQDAFVVYFAREHRAVLEDAAPRWSTALGAALGAKHPPLTRRVAPGIVTAQDPGRLVSYGQLRCGQVAAAAARLHGRRPTLEESRALLAEVGIDPACVEVVQP